MVICLFGCWPMYREGKEKKADKNIDEHKKN